jgi:hypothetical protein
MSNPTPLAAEALSARLFWMIVAGTLAFFAAMGLLFTVMKA